MNLIVQGPALRAEALRSLSEDFRRVTDTAYRSKKNIERETLAAWCAEHKADFAFMPEGRRFAGLKLVAMDMDSTLITMETIDELGDAAGKKKEIAAITAAAMHGELNYSASLRERVALLAGLPESVLADVYQRKLKLTEGAEALIAGCKKHGVQLLLVSGGFTFFVERLAQRLGFQHSISNVLEIRNQVLTGNLVGEIVDANVKARKFKEVMRLLQATQEQTVAIGDGANDLAMMALAGTSVAFRAKPVVRAKASCTFDYAGLDGVLNLFERE